MVRLAECQTGLREWLVGTRLGKGGGGGGVHRLFYYFTVITRIKMNNGLNHFHVSLNSWWGGGGGRPTTVNEKGV